MAESTIRVECGALASSVGKVYLSRVQVSLWAIGCIGAQLLLRHSETDHKSTAAEFGRQRHTNQQSNCEVVPSVNGHGDARTDYGGSSAPGMPSIYAQRYYAQWQSGVVPRDLVRQSDKVWLGKRGGCHARS